MRASVASLPDLARVREFSLTQLLPSGAALLIAFALLAGGAAAYVIARQTSLFALRSLDVVGAPPRVAAHVKAALAPLEGKSLLQIRSAAIERRLEALPDVAAVSFDRDFPHTLRLFVTPAHSVAVLRRGPSAWIVSSDGRVIREADALAAPRLPRVWVPRSTGVDVGSPLAESDASEAVEAIALARAQRFSVRVRTARASAEELTFVLPSGFEIRFGDGRDLALKLAVARRILPLAVRSSAYLDLSVAERPIAGGNTQVSG